MYGDPEGYVVAAATFATVDGPKVACAARQSVRQSLLSLGMSIIVAWG